MTIIEEDKLFNNAEIKGRTTTLNYLNSIGAKNIYWFTEADAAVDVMFTDKKNRIWIMEIKEREYNALTYPTLMIEKNKFDRMKPLQKHLNCNLAYIFTFQDSSTIKIANLTDVDNYTWSIKNMRSSTVVDRGNVDKMVGYINDYHTIKIS